MCVVIKGDGIEFGGGIESKNLGYGGIVLVGVVFECVNLWLCFGKLG